MKLVSIVVPVYNSERFIDQCIESLLTQTYRDIEIICVNDGSKDSSLAKLEALRDKDDRVTVYSKENEGRGAASARNMGLDHAVGEYIMFLDSDDFFEPDMIELLVESAEKKQSELVICTAELFDDVKKKSGGLCKRPELALAPDKDCFSYKDCPEHIFQIGDLLAWNKLFKKDLIDKEGLRFEPIPISDDQYVPTLALVTAQRISVVKRAFIHYRQNSGESQCDNQPRHPEAAYAAFISIVRRMNEMGIYETVKRSYLNMTIRQMREYFDRMTEYDKAEFLYKKYREEIFPFMGATDLERDYFYDPRIGDWYELIMNNSLAEVFFKATRASGDKMSTALLRFQFPYDRVKRGSRIVLVGKGLAGRYWYSQIILSQHCEVAAWVSSEKEIPEGIDFDDVSTAG